MARYTPYYQLAYFEAGDNLQNGINLRHEANRFLTIDQQLFGLYSVLGNGVIAGWDVFFYSYNSDSGITLGITQGSGIIQGLSSQTITPSYISPVSVNTTFYVYAVLNSNTSFNREVTFIISQNILTNNALMIAQVTTGSDNVVNIDSSFKVLLPINANIQNLINNHKHRGIPSKINLQTDVKNQLPGSKFQDFDASKFIEGKLKIDQMPQLNHGDLKYSGVLSHSQLDSVATSLTSNQELLGEIVAVNLMKQNLAMKYSENDIDLYQINILDFIPGISPDSFIDFDNSTANIDLLTKCIVGSPLKDAYVYFYTKNFSFPSKVEQIIFTSTNNSIGEIVFGINTNNSVSFDDYQVLIENQLNNVSALSNDLKFGIQFKTTTAATPVDYNDVGAYMTPIYSNVMQFYYQNNNALSTFNFKISFYSDFGLTNLILVTDTTVDLEGWSVNNTNFPIAGVTINNGETVQILLDPSNYSALNCDQYYYAVIEYDDGGGWVIYDNSNIYIKYCQPSFVDFVDFIYKNETILSETLQFRIKFYEDNERTDLLLTAFSGNDQTGWIINDTEEIPSGGYTVLADESISVTYYPDLGLFQTGKLYYLEVDAWNGSEFISKTADYTFLAASANSNCDQFSHLPVVKNFAFIIKLENNQKVMINI